MEAEGIGRRHLRLTLESLSERQGLAYAAARPKGLDLALSIASEPAALPPIADAVVRGRAIVLDAVATRRRFAGSSPELASLWRATTEATQRLADLAVAPSTADAARQTALIGAAQRDKEATEAALADHSAAFGADLARRDIGLDAVLAVLPARTALVSFVRYDRTAPAPSARPGQQPLRTTAAYAAVVLRGRDADPGAGAHRRRRDGGVARHQVAARRRGRRQRVGTSHTGGGSGPSKHRSRVAPAGVGSRRRAPRRHRSGLRRA